jgi:hypothetical protein
MYLLLALMTFHLRKSGVLLSRLVTKECWFQMLSSRGKMGLVINMTLTKDRGCRNQQFLKCGYSLIRKRRAQLLINKRYHRCALTIVWLVSRRRSSTLTKPRFLFRRPRRLTSLTRYRSKRNSFRLQVTTKEWRRLITD